MKYLQILFFLIPFIAFCQNDSITITDGKVGIKNNNPTQAIDINGDMKISKNLTVGNLEGSKNVVADNYFLNGEEILPKGAIIVWTKKDIPSGWVVCDGYNNHTPDLRARFIIGVGEKDSYTYNVGIEGGSDETKLTEMIAHSHTFKNNDDLKKYEEIVYAENSSITAAGITLEEKDGNTEAVGEQHSSSYSNIPPYYVLIYIMKL